MKLKLNITLLLIVITTGLFAQKPQATVIKNVNLVYLLNNVENMHKYESAKSYLFTTVYLIADPSGSAHAPGSDEITHSIYIAVLEDGEAPEQHLFKLTSVYNPKIVKYSDTSKGPVITISYGYYNNRHTAKITIALKKLTVE